MQKFGASGKGPGCFNDPAGLGVDGQGNMVRGWWVLYQGWSNCCCTSVQVVADSRNHRVCVYSKDGR